MRVIGKVHDDGFQATAKRSRSSVDAHLASKKKMHNYISFYFLLNSRPSQASVFQRHFVHCMFRKLAGRFPEANTNVNFVMNDASFA